jgi:hypothetical protein
MRTETQTARTPRILYAIYDLAVTPNTFDIIEFLTLAEIERRESQCDAFHLFVVPGPNCGFRADADVSDLGRQQYVLRNVIQACPALVPTCAGVTVAPTREFVERLLYVETVAGTGDQLLFPVGYSAHLPFEHYHLWRVIERWQAGNEVPSLQPTPQGLALVDTFLRNRSAGRQILTITLREARFQSTRNSNLEEWGRFVAGLDPRKYAIVVLRDVERVHEPLPAAFAHSLPYPEAVVSIELRAALYRRAYLNLCINNGPSEILRFDRETRYLYFKTITDGVSCTSLAHHRTFHWLEPGDQLPFASPFQRLVWDDDTTDVLTREFDSMVRLIESGTYATADAIVQFLHDKRQVWFERYPNGRAAGGATAVH